MHGVMVKAFLLLGVASLLGERRTPNLASSACRSRAAGQGTYCRVLHADLTAGSARWGYSDRALPVVGRWERSGSISARQTSVMSSMPIRPVSPETGSGGSG